MNTTATLSDLSRLLVLSADNDVQGRAFHVSRSAADVARLVRADVGAAAKGTGALRGCRVSVRSYSYLDCQGLNITLERAPFDLADAEWIIAPEGRPNVERYSSEARAAMAAIERIVAHYNARVAGRRAYGVTVGVNAGILAGQEAAILMVEDRRAAEESSDSRAS